MEEQENKKNILDNITYLASLEMLSRSEVLSAYEKGNPGGTHPEDLKEERRSKHIKLSEVLYGIGGLVVIIGIVTLIAQNWESLGSFARILVSLGSGIAAFIVGIIFSREERLEKVGQVFHLISAALMPTGAFIILYEMGVDIEEPIYQIIVAGLLSALYLASFRVIKQKVFAILSVIHPTWLYFALVYLLIDTSATFDEGKLFMYATLLAGFAYVFIGYAFQRGDSPLFSPEERKKFGGYLYGLGALGFLGAALALTFDNVLWELFYSGFAFAAIFLSVQLKSRAFLIWGSFYLMVYILIITGRHFANAIGWPFALVMAGLALIAVGYFSVQLNKRYIVTEGVQ